jgi:hypothetical protein
VQAYYLFGLFFDPEDGGKNSSEMSVNYTTIRCHIPENTSEKALILVWRNSLTKRCAVGKERSVGSCRSSVFTSVFTER